MTEQCGKVVVKMRDFEWRERLEQHLIHFACAAHQAASSDAARHLRNSGCELLRAVQSSLDGVIDLLDPVTTKTECPPSSGATAEVTETTETTETAPKAD